MARDLLEGGGVKASNAAPTAASGDMSIDENASRLSRLGKIIRSDTA